MQRLVRRSAKTCEHSEERSELQAACKSLPIKVAGHQAYGHKDQARNQAAGQAVNKQCQDSERPTLPCRITANSLPQLGDSGEVQSPDAIGINPGVKKSDEEPVKR